MGKKIEKAKEELIDLAVSFLNTKSGLSILGVEDEELELFLKDKSKRNEFLSYTKPELAEYEISGRLFDKETGDPIVGATASPLFCIISEGQSKKTDKQGKYTFKIETPVVGDGKVILKPQLFFIKDKYVPTTQTLVNRDNTIKTDLPTVELTNLNKAAEVAIKEIQIKMDGGVQKLQNAFLNGVDKIIVLKRKGINKFTDTIKVRLLPLAIQIFVLFGVVKIQDISKGISCPSPDILEDAIKKRNKIVRQLNQIYKVIIVNSALAAVVLYISFQLKGIIAQINSLPIPLSVPPGVGLPYSFIGLLESIKEKLKELSDDNKNLNKQILISLIFLVAALVIILIYLKKIDGMIQKCSIDANLEPLSPELLDLREENERGEVETTPNLNGFIFSVVEDKNEVGNLKRRFAVAKNVDGVILLKGEPSFSAGDQILIDELKFYIQQNNLKAF